ncbi:hypothetical protein BX070DRAFT_236339 [Coemansia spiralis]|nr:hypothetical protein BX070DRAFT_236339 [Coemansia spiralis]
MTASIVNEESTFNRLLKLQSQVVLFYYHGDSQKEQNMKALKRFIKHAKDKGFICCQCDTTKKHFLWAEHEINNSTGAVIYREANYFAHVANLHYNEEQKFAEFDKKLKEQKTSKGAYMTPRKLRELKPVPELPQQENECCVIF